MLCEILNLKRATFKQHYLAVPLFFIFCLILDLFKDSVILLDI
jgi:hypothetical protein